MFKYDLGGKEPQSIYEHPELYEAAFSFRDFKQEVCDYAEPCPPLPSTQLLRLELTHHTHNHLQVEFLKQVHKKHAEGKSLRSVLDLGWVHWKTLLATAVRC